MKRFFTTILLFILSLNLTMQAQSSLTPARKDKKVNEFRTKFFPQDEPAFTILNITPENILQPTSVKEIAANFSQLLNADKKSFAVEFAPALALNGENLTIEKYEAVPALYRTRLSFAIAQVDPKILSTNLSLGIRTALNDESDLRTNKEYWDKASEINIKISEIINNERKGADDTRPPETIAKKPEVKEKIDELTKELNELKEKLSKDSWNADISEIAAGFVVGSKASILENTRFEKFAAWYSAAYGIGSWGQFLIGTNYNYGKDSTDKFISTGNLGAKLSFGTNNFKFYFESQVTFIEKNSNNYLINSGFDFRIGDNLWAEITLGVKNIISESKNEIVTGYKLKYGL